MLILLGVINFVGVVIKFDEIFGVFFYIICVVDLNVMFVLWLMEENM